MSLMGNENMWQNKKGSGDEIYSTIFLAVIAVAVILALAFFITRAQGNASYYEQYYAKQIALLIDYSKPGSEIKINIHDTDSLIKKNNIPLGEAFSFEGNKVRVKLSNSLGYEFSYFSDVKITKAFEYDDNGSLILNLIVEENK